MIVNDFKNNKNADMHLAGYNRDVENLKETLAHLNFSITVKKDIKGNQLVSKVKSYLDQQELEEDDCVAFAIFTHGLENGKLVGSDENTAKLESIISLFTEPDDDNIKYLVGKPKLFFIQACRGTFVASATDDDIHSAASKKRCEQSDVFVFY